MPVTVTTPELRREIESFRPRLEALHAERQKIADELFAIAMRDGRRNVAAAVLRRSAKCPIAELLDNLKWTGFQQAEPG
jgi:hypothetical protein